MLRSRVVVLGKSPARRNVVGQQGILRLLREVQVADFLDSFEDESGDDDSTDEFKESNDDDPADESKESKNEHWMEWLGSNSA